MYKIIALGLLLTGCGDKNEDTGSEVETEETGTEED